MLYSSLSTPEHDGELAPVTYPRSPKPAKKIVEIFASFVLSFGNTLVVLGLCFLGVWLYQILHIPAILRVEKIGKNRKMPQAKEVRISPTKSDHARPAGIPFAVGI